MQREISQFTIAHLCDIHIEANGGKADGVDVTGKFEAVLRMIGAAPGIGLIVVGGDLCRWFGVKSIYIDIKRKLDAVGVPYLCIPGNHDDPALMREIFGPVGETCGCVLESGGAVLDLRQYRLLFMDSSAQVVSEQQREWLLSQNGKSDRDIILFMHHPPVLCGCRFMDNTYPLLNVRDMGILLEKCGRIRLIFCGHYHTELTLVRSGYTLFLTPSTYFQIDTHSAELKTEGCRPAWREIVLTEEGIVTAVRWAGRENDEDCPRL